MPSVSVDASRGAETPAIKRKASLPHEAASLRTISDASSAVAKQKSLDSSLHYKKGLYDKTALNVSSRWTPEKMLGFNIVAVLAFITRFFNIAIPNQIVFDEVHFGTFASYYLRREYFFDVHPPFGKLMFAAVAWLFGYDGWFKFDKIGTPYASGNVPYIAMRSFSALCGAATVCLVYAMLVEMRFSLASVLIGTCMILFDNALTTQCRFILLDAQMIFWIVFACYAWTKFKSQASAPFSQKWWGWLCGVGFGLGFSMGIKFVGLFIVGSIGVTTFLNVWKLTDSRSRLSDFNVLKHWTARFLCLAVLPLLLFVIPYWIHVKVCNKSGPGDEYMSAEYQSTLAGNVISESTLPVYYGSVISLKSKVESSFLHSHPHNYPLRHMDGKVSSEGQQVTGYSIEDDPNNDWVIEPEKSLDPTNSYLKKRMIVKNKDSIRFRHVKTGKYLISHDVASPLTVTNQEVAAAAIENTEDKNYENSIWIIDVKRGAAELFTRICQFRLLHAKTGCGLFNFQQNLPDWGFEQREINAVRNEDHPSFWSFHTTVPHTPWTPAELKMYKDKPPIRKPSFANKFVEIFQKSLQYNALLSDRNPYMIPPYQWPLLIRGISFWTGPNKKGRIYLLGNPLCWFSAIVLLPLGLLLMMVDQFVVKRGKTFLTSEQQKFLYNRGGFFLFAYVMHYAPFFLMGRSLYFHHYLPSYLFSALFCISLYECLAIRFKTLHNQITVISICAIIACVFWKYASLTYGFEYSDEFYRSIKLLPGWHFVM